MKKEMFLKSEIFSSFIIVLGSIFLLSSLWNFSDFSICLKLFFGIYGLTEILKYFVRNKSGDYTNAFGFFISSILLILSFVLPMSSKTNISILFIVFLTILSLTRLKRADYFHDRKNKLWMVEIFLLVIYVISGVLTSIHFANPPETQILILGYFTLICGIIEVAESLILYVTKGKLK